MVTSGGFIRNSFYPFFPWQQQSASRSVESEERPKPRPVENAESILKMRLAKGELTPEAYSELRKLIS